jgi:hypothetical protein
MGPYKILTDRKITCSGAGSRCKSELLAMKGNGNFKAVNFWFFGDSFYVIFGLGMTTIRGIKERKKKNSANVMQIVTHRDR